MPGKCVDTALGRTFMFACVPLIPYAARVSCSHVLPLDIYHEQSWSQTQPNVDNAIELGKVGYPCFPSGVDKESLTLADGGMPFR